MRDICGKCCVDLSVEATFFMISQLSTSLQVSLLLLATVLNNSLVVWLQDCGPPPKEVIESLFGGNATTLSTDERDPIRELSDSIGCCKPAVCQQDLSPIAKVYNRTESAAQRRRRLLSENTYYQKDTCTLNEIKTSWKGQFFDYYNGSVTYLYFTA